MATKVNRKFVLILTAAVFMVAVLVGGLWVLQRRGDTTRHIKAGDQFMAQGEYEAALKMYGRAVFKEPSNLDHLAKMEEALLSIRPQTRDQASELDDMRVGIFAHKARYRPRDPEAHLALIRELHGVARFIDRINVWQRVADAAEDMWERIPSDDPKRVYAKLYKGMADLHLVSPRTETEEEIAAAEQDLQMFLEAVPDHDLGWAALARGQMSIAHQLRIDGKTSRAEQKFREVEETIRRARAAVPDGPEVARVVALHYGLKFVEDREAVDTDELNEAVDWMVELVAPSNDPFLLMESVGILRTVDRTQGIPRAVEMLQQYVNEHPEAHDHRLAIASLEFLNRELDDAYEAAVVVIDAGPVPVSLLSRFQHTLRVQAASLIVDIEYLRWAQADDAEKDAHRQRTEGARDRLASLVAEPENEPLLWRAEGKIAVGKRDYQTAAAKFESVIKRGMTRDFDVLWYASISLEQLGQHGLALERLEAALEQRPRNLSVLMEMARLQYRMGRYEETQETIDSVLRIDPDNEVAQQLRVAIAYKQRGDQVETTDPVATALSDARVALDDGDIDTARATLLGALAQSPESVSVLGELVRVELRAGETDAARGYLAQALARQPNNRILRSIEASLSNEDPVEALKQYLQEIYDDEAERLVYTIIQMRRLVQQLKAIAQRNEDEGDHESAATVRSRTDRADEEAQRSLARIEQIAPDHPVLLEFLFSEALEAGDPVKIKALVDRAQAANADQAGGLIFKGRQELTQQDFEQAVQTLTEATERKHYSSFAWRLLGQAHEGLGNFGEALDAYEESYGCNPNDPFAVRWYVNLLMQTGEKTRALLVLRTARHTIPDDELLQESWLQLEADVGDLALAISRRREIYERSPDNRRNAMQLAAVLGEAAPNYEHIMDEKGGREFAAEEWKVLSASERRQLLEQVRTEWTRESEEILDELEAGDESMEVALLRARLLKARGDIDAGEQVLRRFSERQGGDSIDAATLIALGQYQASVGRLDDAIATLETARKYQSSDQREADRALADLCFARGRWQQAADLYSELLEIDDDRRVRLAVVECNAKLERFDEARRLLQQLTDAGEPGFVVTMLEAAISQGQAEHLYAQNEVEEAEVRLAEAREALARAERLNPSSSLPHIKVAQGLLIQFRHTGDLSLLDDALQALDRADEAQAGAEATSMVRFEVLRAKRDVRGAIGELTRLLERSPDNDEARRMLLQLHMVSNNMESALKVVTEAIDRNPTVALWHEVRGDLYVLQRDYVSAVGDFQTAYHLQPNSGRLGKVVEMVLAVEQPDYALAIDLIRTLKESLESEPALRILYARALHGEGRRDDAVEQMRIAHGELRDQIAKGETGRVSLAGWLQALPPFFAGRGAGEVERFVREVANDEPDAHELHWLARLWSAAGPEGLNRAIELQRLAVERCPADETALRVQLTLMLAQYVLATRDYQGTVDVFEEVIALDAANTSALNNVAYVYAEYLDEPAKAVRYAEQAAALRPDDPSVLDTLGWAKYKSGAYDQAETLLRRCVDLKPSPDNCLHLAHVLAQTGQLESAELYLRRAAELGPGAETRAKIERLADDIAARMKN
ncbi:MAG: tetratricopeptide repeat protein [Planctomycetota bacterium]|jgi:tetratricopeptide (TPR) repeat protein